MGEHNYPIRGNIVRLGYNPDASRGAIGRFCELMWKEASAVSEGSLNFGRNKPKVSQIPHVYYWKGAVVTHGLSYRGLESECVIEMQKDSMEELTALVERLESKMQVKLRKKTVSRA